jgi:hypothetical protein
MTNALNITNPITIRYQMNRRESGWTYFGAINSTKIRKPMKEKPKNIPGSILCARVITTEIIVSHTAKAIMAICCFLIIRIPAYKTLS